MHPVEARTISERARVGGCETAQLLSQKSTSGDSDQVRVTSR